MRKKGTLIGITLLICASFLVGCKTDSNTVIKLADVGWDSIKFHNAVADFIAVNAYGYETEEISATTPLTVQALKGGDIDVIMEMWTNNVVSYSEDIASGAYQELGTNFDDNNQGFYVPRYVIEGDPARGIKPVAPDLKTVADLVKYKDVFVDEEDVTRGRIYGAISGWEIDQVMYNKYKYYGLDKDFNYFRPGSDSPLAAAFSSAYEKGEPVVGYYWEPTWLTGKYDLVLLEDAPYDPETYPDGKTACPPVNVTVCVSNDMLEKTPDFAEFLKKYKTSSKLTAEALAYMQDEKADYDETAKWFLKNHDELISEWLPEDKAELVRNALD
ncbi:ABC transporter substrate-binding protein [Anaerocolumna sp.]|uniref:ABC transporter substrate-binding protein n=1 Tax=Anaerocolumna sp. TaxID=2041569 RepID=UPI0028AEFB22|nr:ABC transporter substrate-binding protein [Anaerocolumna sp.]